MASGHADLLRQLQGALPPALLTAVVGRLKSWFAALKEAEGEARAAHERLVHLRANCAAEEQTRVWLLEKQGPLDHEKSKLERELAKAEERVAQAREAKRSITEEIERLNSDLFSEAHKLVAEELREKDELRAREAVIQDEYARLRSRLMLERDRYKLAAGMVRELCEEGAGSSFSMDEEILSAGSLSMFSADAEADGGTAPSEDNEAGAARSRVNSM